MMQAEVCLRQDTETTLPELTEQHRISLKEEELSGLESVHMAETECAAAVLHTLEPECVTAHSGVSDVHHPCTSLIKTETDLGSTHTGDLIKTESLNSTELGYVTHLDPDRIKSEAGDGGYLKAEHTSDLKDIKCIHIESDQIKCESSECLVSDLKSCVMTGAVDHKHQTKPWQCARELNPNCKKEEMQDLLIQCGDLNYHCDTKNGDNPTRVVLKSANVNREPEQCQRTTVAMEPVCKSPQLSIFHQTEAIHKQKGEIHTGEKPYKCIHCNKCLTTNNALKVHLRTHAGEKPYKCTECGKSYRRHASLQLHLKIHGENPYVCTVCEKNFFSKSNLYKHQRIHSGEKPYKCPQCGKHYSERSHLTAHQRIHTGEKPYKCLQCGKCFSQSCQISVHLRIHTGEKPYKCAHCGKCFSLTHQLSVHQRVHTGEKPYKCIQCGKCFSRSDVLNKHKMAHAGDKPYKCPQCGKHYSQRSHLIVHQRIHTGEKPYKCIQCGKCFTQSSTLNTHKKCHTADKTNTRS